MKSETSISEIMTKDVIFLDAMDPIRHAEETFGNYSVRHAPILSNGALVGMLSLTDVQQKVYSTEEGAISTIDSLIVQKIMTPDPVTVQASATVHEVATLFTENNFHAIPVLDGDRVAGIVSTTDIIRFFLE